MTKKITLITTIVILISCANGGFVGTAFVPTKMYDGERVPDAEIATIYWGFSAQTYTEGTFWMSPILGVNGKPCKTNSLLNYSDPSQSWCGQLVQVKPGEYKFTNIIRSASDSVSLGGGSISRKWLASKPFEMTEPVILEAGVVYAVLPSNVESHLVSVKKLCASENHISTIKKLFHNRTLNCEDIAQ